MEMIYKLMLAMIFLLSKEIPLEQLYEKDNMCKLKKVAEAIHYNAIYVDRYDYNMALTLVALGFVESRYGVTEEGLVISKRGACGIFQIMPRYTEYSCIEYFDLITSAMVATRIVKQIKDTCTLKYPLLFSSATTTGCCVNFSFFMATLSTQPQMSAIRQHSRIRVFMILKAYVFRYKRNRRTNG